MKRHYYPETDNLYIELRVAPGAETREVADGVRIDLDADREIVRIDIDQAATKVDLAALETTALPKTRLKAA